MKPETTDSNTSSMDGRTEACSCARGCAPCLAASICSESLPNSEASRNTDARSSSSHSGHYSRRTRAGNYKEEPQKRRKRSSICTSRYSAAPSTLASWIALVALSSSFIGATLGDRSDKLPDLSIIPTPPTFNHGPNPDRVYFVLDTQPAVEGTSAIALKRRIFNCKATGYPGVAFSWLKDGKPLDIEGQSDRMSQLPGEGTLVIEKLKSGDEGKYQCLAANGNGTAYDKPIFFNRTWINYFQKQSPIVYSVKKGQDFHVDCDNAPQSEPKANVYWIRMGDQQGQFNTINKSHISVNDKGTIFFQSVMESDESMDGYKFTCTAENTQLKDYKFGNRFTLKVDKTNIRQGDIAAKLQYVSHKDLIGLKGEDLEIFCIYSGRPVPEPSWKKDGKPLDVFGRVVATNFMKSIKITDFKASDAGSYKCDFEYNPELNKDFSVSMHAAPYWANDLPPASQNSSEGEQVQFDCKAEGIPEPTYKFFKNGKPLNADSGRVSVSGSVLTIVNLMKGQNGEGDNAVYQCEAENQYGKLWTNFYLNILAFSPVILHMPDQFFAIMRQPTTMKCQVFGSPLPEVKWLSHSKMGSSNQIPQDPTPDRDGWATLEIKDVSKDMEGTWTCSAVNKYNRNEPATKTAYLRVRNATRIDKYPVDAKYTAGQRIRLPCSAQHDKNLALTVEWLRDGKLIPRDDYDVGLYLVDTDSSLIIPEANNLYSADYTCVAKTDLDEIRRTAKIIIKDVPDVPSRAKIDCTTERTALLDGIRFLEQKSTVTPMIQLWVQYQVDPEENPNDWFTYPVPIKRNDLEANSETLYPNQIVFTGQMTLHVEPYGKYVFRLIAENEVGWSAPLLLNLSPNKGKQLPCVTTGARPERNPVNVRAEGNTPNNLVVYWDPMPREEWHGPKFAYLIEYRPSGHDAEGKEYPWEFKNVEDPYTSHVVIDDTETYVPYEVKVTAKNDFGTASVTPETIHGFSGEGIPDSPVTGFEKLSHTATTATFRWDEFTGDAAGDFKGYKVVHWHVDDDESGKRRRKRSVDEKHEAIFDPDSTSGTVYGLKPNKLNKAYIVPFNGANDGPKGAVIAFTLPPGPPSPVRELRAWGVSHKEVALFWTEPREMNGDLKHYMVKYCEISGWEGRRAITNDNNCPENTVPAGKTFYRAKGLQPLTEYRFLLSAVVNNGDDGVGGDLNSVDAKTLPTDVNNADPVVPGVRISGVEDDHINVTWIPGTFDEVVKDPVGEDFIVKFRLKGSNEWRTVEPKEGNLTTQLGPLDPGTTYEIKAVSVYEDTEGNKKTKESHSAFITTSGQAPKSATAAWLIAIIVAIIILIIILIIVCLVVRNRGAKYPVSEKEREQGREPMLGKEEKGFGEYARPEVDEEKRSLTGESKPESETDSLAQYGDVETANFGEDGSFIGQYGAPAKVLYAPGQEKARPTTFV